MKKMLLNLLLPVCLLPGVCSAEHVIQLQAEQLTVTCPGGWMIIAHKPTGSPADMVAFQIPDPADEGTTDSTNLAVMAFDMRETEAMLQFTQALLKHSEEKHAEKKVGEWAVFAWSGKQGETDYEIQDCYRTLGSFGVHVRLAMPKLAGTTKEWKTKLEADFVQLLETMVAKGKA